MTGTRGPEYIRFLAEVISITEDRLDASLGHGAKQFGVALFDEWVAAGRPPPVPWLEAKLPEHFRALDARPVWVEGQPRWAYLNGRPMTFIRQLTVPRNATSEAALAPDVELYVFGAQVPYLDGFRMEYSVVEQQHGLQREDEHFDAEPARGPGRRRRR
jgi:hypothetical protein